jgi:hypothetical protein
MWRTREGGSLNETNIREQDPQQVGSRALQYFTPYATLSSFNRDIPTLALPF